MRKMRIMTMTVLLMGGVANAEDKKPEAPPPPAAPAAPGAARADVKAGTGVEKHEVVGEATTFSKDTMVWVWSRVFNADKTSVKHVWKLNNNVVWTAVLPIGSTAWSTMSRMKMSTAGTWEVDVQSEGGTSLGKTTFTIN